jgi:mono/diheme cytochrome c family protein
VDKEKLTLNCNSNSFSVASSLRRTAELGAFAAIAVALVILGFLGPVPSAAAADDAGPQAYKSNCVVCHGADGTGTPTGKSLKAPDLHSDAVQKMTNQQIEDQIANGKNNMPPFKSTLSKAQITALAAYVHSEFGKKK